MSRRRLSVLGIGSPETTGIDGSPPVTTEMPVEDVDGDGEMPSTDPVEDVAPVVGLSAAGPAPAGLVAALPGLEDALEGVAGADDDIEEEVSAEGGAELVDGSAAVVTPPLGSAAAPPAPPKIWKRTSSAAHKDTTSTLAVRAGADALPCVTDPSDPEDARSRASNA